MQIPKLFAKESDPQSIKTRETDIVIIGGGATGLGIARDAAMRGFKVILIEKGSIGSGASGHFHGLLHSGARYAVSDQPTAIACIKENQILRRIAAPAITDTGGLFLALSNDEVAFSEKLIMACRQTNIPIEEVPLSEIVRREPKLVKSPQLLRALKVPDAYINGLKLLDFNRRAAESAATPALFLTNTEVSGLKRGGRNIEAVFTRNISNGEKAVIKCRYVVNAAGAWARTITQLANIKIDLMLDKGAMLAVEGRSSNSILNRCRPEADGDIIVPVGNRSIIGTTSVIVSSPERLDVSKREVDKLFHEGEQMVPDLTGRKIQAVFSSIRPLFGVGSMNGNRELSRYFQVLDHADEGADNFISVIGGKVTIYRYMAEVAVDLICHKENVSIPCQTANVSL